MKGALKDNMSPQEWRDYMAKQNAAKESRYKAVPTETNDGQHFKSHIEASYYKRCWVLKQSGEVTLIEREVRYELIVNGVFICAYLMDFRITYADGHIEYIDCKSDPTITPIYRLKKQLMLACHGIELKEIFAHDLKN
jgi:hypothetical protein